MKRLWWFTLIFLMGCNAGKNQTNIEVIQNMMDQQSIKSQDWYPTDGDRTQMRHPPEGTVPRGFEVYPYPNDPEAAGQNLKNPLAGDFSAETLELGQKNYVIYCGVCHGMKGDGLGPVAAAMAVKPPALLSDKVRTFPDGRIYHIIVRGQGVMGSYASQIPAPKRKDEKDRRWAIVNYIRSLQKGN